MERAKRYNRKLSLLMVDIDHFKNYNHSYGHLHGDELLRQIAKTMEKSLRKPDIVGRYGDEEFLVLLPETDKRSAHRVAEKLRKAVEKHDFHHKVPSLGPGKITTHRRHQFFPVRYRKFLRPARHRGQGHVFRQNPGLQPRLRRSASQA